jgi:hypothetical protein
LPAAADFMRISTTSWDSTENWLDPKFVKERLIVYSVSDVLH